MQDPDEPVGDLPQRGVVAETGGRAWSSFRFFFKGKDVTADMLAHEPNWVELRKAAGQVVPPGM